MVIVGVGASLGYAQSTAKTKTIGFAAFSENDLQTSVISAEAETETIITSADVAFESETQPRDPDGIPNTHDEFFLYIITACIFHSNESIPGPDIIITCKLTDDANGPDVHGNVIAQGTVTLEDGYTASNRVPIPITETAFPDANEVQIVHDVKIVIEGPPPSFEGCTPGFWKTHPEAWPPTGYSPNQKFKDVFDRIIKVKIGTKQVTNPTLLQALSAQGGGLEKLVRHSVAALLNAAHPTVDPEPDFDTAAEVIAAFQQAFDNNQFEPLATRLDESNNRKSEICA